MYAHRNPTNDEIREYGMYKRGDEKPEPKGQGKGRCSQFLSIGSCTYGDKCIFTHTDQPTAKSKAASKPKGKRNKRPKSDALADEWEREEEDE